MTDYKCFECQKKVSDTMLGRKVRCPYCGAKMLFKPRTTTTHVKAR